MTGSVHMGVTAMQDERDASLSETCAQSGAVPVTEAEVEHSGRQIGMAGQLQAIAQIARAQNRCTGVAKPFDNVERNERLVLDDED